MRSRRRLEQNMLVPWQESPVCDTGQYVLAPVTELMDIIDMCACIGVINSSVVRCNEDSLSKTLKACYVFKARHNRHGCQGRAQTFIAFRATCERLPQHFIQGRGRLTVRGSNYVFYVAAVSSYDPYYMVGTSMGGSATQEECMNNALVAAAFLINEALDPTSLMFKDAVVSRFSFLARQQSKTPVVPTLPPKITASPLPNNTTCLPCETMSSQTPNFKKPDFDSIEDLLHSFATHSLDNDGPGRPISPSDVPVAKSKCQSFVFCAP